MTRSNGLQIGILILGLAASTTCHAQNGLMLTAFVNFNGTNGNQAFSRPIQGKDGLLYGTTGGGGAFGQGTIFKTTLAGSLTTLVSFNGTNGEEPVSSPILAADGNFYGTTELGGDNDEGTVYKMDSNGVLTTLF